MAQRRQSVRGRVRVVAQAKLPTRFGQFTILGVEGRGPAETAVVQRHGRLSGHAVPLVRIHSQCLTGDVLA
jgi:GTP cyclohydrolase II